MFAIILIAIGLAMDAVAVSISAGVCTPHIKKSQAAKIGGYFGLFQALMPLAGWVIGYYAGKIEFVERVDHWIAAGILGWVGGKMIHEGMKHEDDKCRLDYLKTKVLLVLAVATSIDALAVGFSLALMNISILEAALVIGLITFVLSFFAVIFGKKFGHLAGSKVDFLGGAILIGIGLKILAEHLWQITLF